MESREKLSHPAGLGLAVAVAVFFVAVLSGAVAVQMPGPLSASHAVKPGSDCAACHAGPGKIDPAKCLACHTEIGSRIAAHQGFHRDKAQDCAVCHAEHQGRDVDLTHLDPADFDHAETGADLRGAHLKIDPKSCDTCHAKDRVLPRQYGRSYLLKVPGCRGCHAMPHPGREDQCLACHNQDSWSVGGRTGKD